MRSCGGCMPICRKANGRKSAKSATSPSNHPVVFNMLTTFNVIWKKEEGEKREKSSNEIDVGEDKKETSSTVSDFETMINDVEDLIEEQQINETEKLYRESKCPNEKFNKKNKLSITDLSSQLWCEQQLELVLTTGKKRETEAMRLGIERHEILEKEDHKIINVEVNTREESLGYRLLNTITLLGQLYEYKKAREIWVFGVIRNYVLRGIIDELRIEYDNVSRREYLIISDTKTRKEKKEPSLAQKRTSAIQVQTYCLLLQHLKNGKANYEKLLEIYECDPLFEFTSIDLVKYKNLKNLCKVVNHLFLKLPKIKEEMEIVYEHKGVEFSRNLIPYFYQSTLYTINFLLDYWDGKRSSDVVENSDKWKCKFCDFVRNCVRKDAQQKKCPAEKTPSRKNTQQKRRPAEKTPGRKDARQKRRPAGKMTLPPCGYVNYFWATDEPPPFHFFQKFSLQFCSFYDPLRYNPPVHNRKGVQHTICTQVKNAKTLFLIISLFLLYYKKLFNHFF
ncbi:exonuclease V, mitochondrial, putative [Plasmodium ovale wallikeri]|uniref:Exonuclease V, mitochondrial, putative n=1 Tax=Plasmodium ovale wallikeri TaxID=864142 RepID=A0A1A8ZF79_PLAOA|nr:exonuclease V, mitochondrial, putative [Plasmodium ovale wallikeri]